MAQTASYPSCQANSVLNTSVSPNECQCNIGYGYTRRDHQLRMNANNPNINLRLNQLHEELFSRYPSYTTNYNDAYQARMQTFFKYCTDCWRFATTSNQYYIYHSGNHWAVGTNQGNLGAYLMKTILKLQHDNSLPVGSHTWSYNWYENFNSIQQVSITTTERFVATCVDCSVGNFSASDDFNVKCFNCSAGYFQTNTGQTNCNVCPAGTYTDTIGQEACLLCPKGKYSNQTGATECTVCSSGWVQGFEGQTACYQCLPGTYVIDSLTPCVECPQGKYSNQTGATECTVCLPGSFSAAFGSNQCTLCDINQYTDKFGSVQCNYCSVGQEAIEVGSVKCSLCPANSYKSIDDTHCISCPTNQFAYPGSASCIDEYETCMKCDPNVCSIGTYLADSCVQCLNCTRTHLGDHWVFAGNGNIGDPYSCPMQCEKGYFLEGEICVLHTNLTCASDEFLLTGSSLFDAECVKCQTCEGKRQVRNCSQYENAQCEACQFKAFTEFLHNNCTEQCMKDYVFNEDTQVCEYCADFKCLPGFYTPDATIRRNCSHCLACPYNISNAIYLEECTFQCISGYEKKGGSENPCLKISQNVVTANNKKQVACPRGSRLTQNYECELCDVMTPNPSTENTTWSWNLYGNACEWQCKTGFFLYTHVDNFATHAPRCIIWQDYYNLIEHESVIANVDTVRISNMQQSVKPKPKKIQLTITTAACIASALFVSTLLLLKF